jgi:predicted component of type VI protein secretion system
MAVTLIVQKGVHRGRRIPITVREFSIGRDPECHLRPSSKDVHWEHCAIITRAGAAFLRDNGGASGTYLNQRLLVGGEMQLEEGDQIQVGPLAFQVALTLDSFGESPEEDDGCTRATPAPSTKVRDASAEPAASGKKGSGSSPFHPVLTPKPMQDCQEILCYS